MQLEGQTCLFCGGDASAPDHTRRCDGRQGTVEADFRPLASGLTAETYGTSRAAADSVEDNRAAQRMRVLLAIKATGADGATDDELQCALDLDGSSERPRRWELWKLDLITERRDVEGKAVRRQTRSGRSAVVWITTKAVA